MSSIIDELTRRLGGSAMTQLGNQLGTDPATATRAVGAALPALLGALARNAATDDGASALSAAVARDHDGSILDNVPAALANPQTTDGAGILGHVFGAQRDSVAAGVGQSSGLDPSKAVALLTMLAPLVMGALGRAQRSGNLDPGGLASEVGQAHTQVVQGKGLGGLLGALDRNRDGSVVDDIAGMAGKLFNQ
jgi:hypothetical protein